MRRKTEKEVLREYQDERWGALLRTARSLRRPTLRHIEGAHVDEDATLPYFKKGRFYLATEREILGQHIELYSKVLRRHSQGAAALVELGAGFGSKLLSLGVRGNFKKLPLIAGEFTESGRKLIKLLAKSQRRDVSVGYCDFRRLRLNDLSIPENSVIFTSYAVHYVPHLSQHFVDFLARLRPKMVVHFEPCYEHYTRDSLHGAMCRRYVELNDYSRNLVSVIDAKRAAGLISCSVQRNVLGGNPFLPISVIEWRPKMRSAA